jgi:trimethylamine---corrinoid protein Co-methyltransferase
MNKGGFNVTEHQRRGGHRGGLSRNTSPAHHSAYIHLQNPFIPQPGFSEDEIAAIHDTALRILENLGIKVLLEEGRTILKSGGARVDEESMMVCIGRDMVEAALATAPKSIRLRAANPMREQIYAPGAMLFEAGSGCPNAFDHTRGRRPGSLRDYCETLKLQQSFDVIHLHGPSAEPQDVPVNLRHYAMMQGQLTLGDLAPSS